jgi:radical SAM protein with 4Fe4S-binding SPASM domain
MSWTSLKSLPVLQKVKPLVGELRKRFEDPRYADHRLLESTPAHGLKRIATFHFDIVQGCQLSCVGCPNSVLHPKIDHISPETFAQCLANVDVHQIDLLRLFNYGEPFLHPNIKGLLDVLKQQPWRAKSVEISTNGMIFDEQKVRDIISSGAVDIFFVSCDGDGTPESFEQLRPPAKWDKLLLFLRGVARIKQELGSNIRLRTRTVIPYGKGQERWRSVVEPLGWEPEFREWIVLPNTSGRPWDRPVQVENKACNFVEGVNLFVNCHGNVIPCCAYPNLDSWGNLKDQKFSEIHHGKLRQAFREHLRTDRVNDKICGECEQ